MRRRLVGLVAPCAMLFGACGPVSGAALAPDTLIGFAILALITFAAFTVHATIGFASMVSALAVGAMWFEPAEIRPPLVAVSLVVNLWLAGRHRAEIAWPLLGREVLPWMGAGAVLGLTASAWAATPLARRVFGVFVLAVALREAVRLVRASEPPRLLATPPRGWVFAAGVVHGLFATGGPPLVYALARVQLDKGTLRATLAVVWFALNLGLLVAYTAGGAIDARGFAVAGGLVPVTAAAVAVGSWAHDRVDARRFRLVVYVVLAATAVALIVR